MRKIILTTITGGTMEMKDHTEYFRKSGGEAAVQKFYETVVNAACTPRCAAKMSNIKSILIYNDDVIVKTLVLDGRII